MTSFQSQSAITRKELTQETCDINNINIPPLPLINRISTAPSINIPPFPKLPTIQQSQSISPNNSNTNIIEQTPLPLQSHSMSPTINTNHLSQSQSHIITKTQINSNRKRSREPCIHDITDNKDTKRRVKFVLFEYGLPNGIVYGLPNGTIKYGTTHSSLICESECECQNSDLCLMSPCEQGNYYIRFERLNFEFTTSEVKHRETWNRRKNWIGRAIQARGLWKWCMCLSIGIFTGTCMFLISIAIKALIGLNLNWANDALKSSFAVGFLRFLGVNCLFALISGSLVSFIAPPAAGSGIPDVKGWLNGSSIPGLFQMKTFVVKLVGVIFSVSAKFIIGKEGPMVHAGSALASGMALGRNKTMEFDTKTGYSFRNDVDGRDLISCGVAAGVAAAFGAPIGGMLFALEEVASFWLPGLTWRAFFAASKYPTITSTINPTHIPSISPSNIPTYNPTYLPSINPTLSQFNRHQYHQQYYQQYHQQYFQQ